MIRSGILALCLLLCVQASWAQKIDPKEFKTLQEKVNALEQLELRQQERIQQLETNLQIESTRYTTLVNLYEVTNDRFDNNMTMVTIVASVFGFLFALAGIYIGFESLRSQNRHKDAVKTLEEAKDYVTGRKTEFDKLLESQKSILQQEYDKFLTLLKEKLISDIGIETSKVREMAEKKSEEIQNYSVAQEHDKTIELLEKRLEFFENVGIPDDPEVLFSKAKILREKNMKEEGIKLFERVVEKVSKHESAYFFLGYDYADLGNIDQSILNYKKHLELYPNDVGAINNLALQYKAKGDFIEAIDLLNKAIALSDKKELYYTNRISVHRQVNKIERIVEDFVKLVAINPSAPAHYAGIIESLNLLGRNDEALEYYDKAINQFKDDAKLLNIYSYNKALFLGGIDKVSEALAIFQELHSKGYSPELCLVNIAKSRYQLGHAAEAIDLLNKELINNPLLINLYVNKARFQIDQSLDDAKATLQEGGAQIGTVHFFFHAGRDFHEFGLPDIARFCYERALEMISRNVGSADATEGDLMNFYETTVILEKSPEEFDQNYRNRIASAPYLHLLVIMDAIRVLLKGKDTENLSVALQQLKRVAGEFERVPSSWNFDDILQYVRHHKNPKMYRIVSKIVEYAQGKFSYEELQATVSL